MWSCVSGSLSSMDARWTDDVALPRIVLNPVNRTVLLVMLSSATVPVYSLAVCRSMDRSPPVGSTCGRRSRTKVFFSPGLNPFCPKFQHGDSG